MKAARKTPLTSTIARFIAPQPIAPTFEVGVDWSTTTTSRRNHIENLLRRVVPFRKTLRGSYLFWNRDEATKFKAAVERLKEMTDVNE